MKRFVLLVAVGLAGCGGAAEDSDSAESDATASRLPRALYVSPPGAVAPRGDWVPAMSVGIDAKRPFGTTPSNSVRYLTDHAGSPTRVTGACLGSWEVKRGKLALACSDPTLMTFTILGQTDRTLKLQNDTGESFTLDRVDPEARADVRAECDAEPFTLRLDITKLGTARRVVFHVSPKANVFQGQSPRGIFALSSAAGATTSITLKGTDFYDEELDVKLPRDPAGDFKGSLVFFDPGAPFQLEPKTHALACRVVR
ncbi:MAG TPA: hypothetical protein VLT33_34540 [Labilithrix sp.]|nr:hypothetical protein [Labilithrix sp.]